MEGKEAQDLLEQGLAEFGRGNWEAAKSRFAEARSADADNRPAGDYLEYMEAREREDREELGDLKKIPLVGLSSSEIMKLNISPQTAYLLSLTDGFLTLEEIVSTSGLGPQRTRRELARLKRMGIIKIV